MSTVDAERVAARPNDRLLANSATSATAATVAASAARSVGDTAAARPDRHQPRLLHQKVAETTGDNAGVACSTDSCMTAAAVVEGGR